MRDKDTNTLENKEPSTQPDDAALLTLARNGYEPAMALLFERHSRLVYSVALSVLRDPASAEDVLQEVFMRIWHRPSGFTESRGSLGAWLAAVARNRSIDELRRKRPTEQIDELGLATSCHLEAQVEHRGKMDKVWSVVQELPSEQRRMIQMAFFHGLTHTEIAEITGDPLGTVKARMRGGLSALKKSFQATCS